MAGFEGLLTGRTLAGRYTIGEVIGRGGFAAVYEATDERLDRVVAVKVITLGGPEEVREEVRRRFHREARASASLHHPNVVSVYDFGTDPELKLDFLVMERLRGEDLRARMRRGEPIPPPMAVRILREAADGVDAGHHIGLVHRDLKPGNIFLAQLNRAGWFRVCVVDFGIARIVEGDDTTRITRHGIPLSPAYASPEQLRGDPELSLASDVFSLGVIGYELLAGERPFKGDRLHPPPGGFPPPRPLRELNPAVPESVAQAIHRALAEDLDERFPDAGAFAAALAAGEAELSPAPADTTPPAAPELAAAPADAPSPAAPAIAAGLAASAGAAAAPDAAASPEPVASAGAAASPESAVAPEAAAPPEPVVPVEPVAAREPVGSSPPVVSTPVAPTRPARPTEPATPAPRAGGPRVVVEPALVAGASAPASAGTRSAAGEARRPASDGAPGQTPPPAMPRKRRAGGRVAVIALIAALVLALGWMGLRNVGRDTASSADGRVAGADAEEQARAADPAGAARNGGAAPAGGAAPGGRVTTGGQAAPGSQAVPGSQVAQGPTAGPGGIERPPAGARRVEPGVASPATTPDRPASTRTATIPRVPAAAPAPPPAPRRSPAPTATAAAPPPAPAVGGGSAATLNREGETLFARGDIAGAAARFRAAVQAAPTSAAYRNNLGWALFQLGDIDGAGRELSETIRLDPRRAIAHANMGEVHRARGDIAAAIAAYERFLELNTDPRREQIARGKLRGLRGGS